MKVSQNRIARRRNGGAGEWLISAALALAVLVLFGAAPCARASVSVLLEQPYGKLGLLTPTGHTALYFDNICAESLTELRPCRPGELGVVLSRYDNVGGYDWLAVPLVPYLYGVAHAEDIPDSMNRADEIRLRDAYRRAYLESVAPDLPNGDAPKSNWYELVGSAFDRTIYGFRVKTTPAQDAALIAYFNDSRNHQRYNGMFINCADFVRTTINRIYPHAIGRNYIADAGMTSPKSVARALSHYAKKHPGVEFSTFVVPQVPGSLGRSRSAMTAAEGVVKRYSPPLLFISPVCEGVALAAYLTEGRFSMPKKAPDLDVRALAATAKMEAELPALAVSASSSARKAGTLMDAPEPAAPESAAPGLAGSDLAAPDFQRAGVGVGLVGGSPAPLESSLDGTPGAADGMLRAGW